MAGGRVFSCNNTNSVGGSNNLSVLLQSQRVPSSSEPMDPLFIPRPGSSPYSFFVSGTRSMVSFEDVHGGNRSFFRSFDEEENGDEDLDEYFHQPEKKRRLTVDQVQFLEKSFEVENKLEPERKTQLAKELGLQPRQVAIWFQNRRARWKTKQLEKDYDTLQASFNTLKDDYGNLLKEKDKLKQEVLQLTDKLVMKEKNNSELSDVNTVCQEPPQKPVDSDSPHSSYPFEPDQSDTSQDEEDNLSKALFQPSSYIFPKLEDNDYSDPPASSCSYGFHVEDHAFWSSAY
ncbi:hypothetical protein ERO13_D07G069800v2 [Gossypium hirsutum]|uniref:Homeobox-leucine zipper protein n=5 Tax=Gossypium TaxID=3633 RepID=A0A1U8NZD9_GOSHI|nr:homeobox-leucine zipper protein HAT5 [Gossypium raimondii]XP_016744331.1 homeobox-leucine zipper protein HAT5 isoform X1 [Gossypium hirsutum]KAB2020507.1 hypothetical protein ES319_D07G073100v1 [Gossypium barbadense]TYG60537.1 hypothetical protein ES288_D07G076500v1 [Gossypium darwinii]KAG4137405.1 hypothetical protein ERO13_D07G069800v2 [Gossypium hirsutum]KJB08244.1 hypothetical protein B456_001G073600 [Gossypium raimondii]